MLNQLRTSTVKKRSLWVSVIGILLLFSSCSGVLVIRVEDPITLTPFFKFYQCDECNSPVKVFFGALEVGYYDEDKTLHIVWEIRLNEQGKREYVDGVKYGAPLMDYDTIVKPEQLEAGKLYYVFAIAGAKDSPSTYGAKGSFVLYK